MNREVANDNYVLFFILTMLSIIHRSLLFVINKRSRKARAAFQKNKVQETVIDRFRRQPSALSSACKASISRKRCRGMNRYTFASSSRIYGLLKRQAHLITVVVDTDLYQRNWPSFSLSKKGSLFLEWYNTRKKRIFLRCKAEAKQKARELGNTRYTFSLVHKFVIINLLKTIARRCGKRAV